MAGDDEAKKRPRMTPTAAMKAVFLAFLDGVGDERFRRSSISDRLYPLTKPRSRESADALADALIRDAAKAGKVVREGHLHWIKVQTARRLKSGREVPEQAEVGELTLSTRVPGKWVAIDLETGEAWSGTPAGWKRASMTVVQEARNCLARAA